MLVNEPYSIKNYTKSIHTSKYITVQHQLHTAQYFINTPQVHINTGVLKHMAAAIKIGPREKCHLVKHSGTRICKCMCLCCRGYIKKHGQKVVCLINPELIHQSCINTVYINKVIKKDLSNIHQKHWIHLIFKQQNNNVCHVCK